MVMAALVDRGENQGGRGYGIHSSPLMLTTWGQVAAEAAAARGTCMQGSQDKPCIEPLAHFDKRNVHKWKMEKMEHLLTRSSLVWLLRQDAA